MADTMKIQILPDGSIKVDSDKISGPNHMSAEAFMRELATAGGAKQERKHKHGVLGAALHAAQHTFGMGHGH